MSEEKKESPSSARSQGSSQSGNFLSKLKSRARIQAGDWQVQVNVLEARELKGVGVSDMSDPVVEARVLGEKRTTRVHKASLSPVFDECLFFELAGVSAGQIEQGRVEVRVLDANALRRDTLIGAFTLDLAAIYYGENHEIWRRWVALTDTTGKRRGVQGYLRLSVTVLGPGDEQVMHLGADSDDDEEGGGDGGDGTSLEVLVAPTVRRTPRLLRVRAFLAEELPAMDRGLLGRGKCDPFVEVEFGGFTVRGKHKSGQAVSLLQELTLPVYEPVDPLARVRVTVYDWDAAGGNDRIRTVSFAYADAAAGRLEEARWTCLYGAPPGQQKGPGRVASRMNRGELAGSESFYRGRLLADARVDEPGEEDEMETGVRPCNAPDPMPATTEYEVQLDLYEACGVPAAGGGKASVEVAFGTVSMASREAKVEGGRVVWYDELEPKRAEYPADPTQAPRVFVYLVVKSRRVAFWTAELAGLLERGWDAPPAWHALAEDPVERAFEGALAGSLLFSLRVGPAASAPAGVSAVCRPLADPAYLEAVSAPLGGAAAAAAPLSTVGTLTVRVLRARSLPALDRGGSSDPYAKVRVGDDEFKTSVKEKTVEPEWDEEHTFERVHVDTPVRVELKDRDRVGRNESMGVATLALGGLSDQPPGHDFRSEAWHLLDGPHAGAAVLLRITFRLLPLSESRAAEPRAAASAVTGPLGAPRMRQYQLRAHVYTARGLRPRDRDAGADPYLVVHFAGREARTPVRRSTLNPDYFCTLCFNVSLPLLSLAPPVQVEVMDRDKFSADDRLGQFSVGVADGILNDGMGGASTDPRWFDLCDWRGRPARGSRVLAAFQLLDGADAAAPVPDIRPASVRRTLELTVLGLRDLTSALGVHKAQCAFELPGGARLATRRSAVPSARNPNFLEVVRTPVEVFENEIFAQPVGVRVSDCAFGGLVKRGIGSGYLELPRDDGAGVNGEGKEEEEEDIVVRAREAARLARERAAAAAAKAAAEAEAKGGGKKEREEHKRQQQQQQQHDDEDEKYPDNVSEESQPLLLSSPTSATAVPAAAGPAAAAAANPTPPRVDASELAAYEASAAEADDEAEYMRGRLSVDNELEDEMRLEPFLSVPLTWGAGKSARRVGSLKGLARLVPEGGAPVAPAPDRDGDGASDLLVPRAMVARLYVLTGDRLVPRDRHGSDPYLVVRLGGREYSTRDRHLSDTTRPAFFETFEMPCTIPGDASLDISVLDWDGVPGGLTDDLIGSTSVDLENRWFSPGWRALEHKPLEWRTLRSATSSRSQGKLSVIVELLDAAEARRVPPLKVAPPPPQEYVLRVVLWCARDVPVKDTVTKQSDIYIAGSLECPDEVCPEAARHQRTDTHMRAKEGKGNFNWRLVYPLTLPPPPGAQWPRLRLAAYDQDYFSFSDSICEASVSLKGLCRRAMRSHGIPVSISGEGADERFWLRNLRHPNDDPESDEAGTTRLELSVRLMTKEAAALQPAGQGRSDPNLNPHLPEPEGRFHFQLLHPLDTLRGILGDELYNKIKWFFLAGFILCMCIWLAPFFTSMVSIVHDLATL